MDKTGQKRVLRRWRGAGAKATADEALKALKACVKWLDGISPHAARSLEEGLEETLGPGGQTVVDAALVLAGGRSAILLRSR